MDRRKRPTTPGSGRFPQELRKKAPAATQEPSPTQFSFTRAQNSARDMLISDAVHCALGGGSRSGKTFLLVRQVLVRALKAPGSRHALFRFHFNSIKASIIYDTLPKVLALCFPSLPARDEMLNKTDWFLQLPNGSELWFGGLDDKERTEKILGQEYATIYFNECSQIPWSSVELAHSRLAQKVTEYDLRTGEPRGDLRLKAFYDFNPPSKMHWTYQVFIEKRDPITKQPYANEFNYGFYLINPYDNKENLAPGYLAILEGMSPKKRDRFLLGKFADDSDGALWTIEVLEAHRELGRSDRPLPDMIRMVVGVDPSGATGAEDDRSDAIGIAVVGLGSNGHAYVFEDLTIQDRPEVWGQVAVDAYGRNKADRVVGEMNYGGDMVRSTIHAVDDKVPFKPVSATRGKVIRAEPISVLYHQGKVHHVGYFPDLEDELCAFLSSGYIGEKSPNRADAVIWCLTELFHGITTHDEHEGKYRQQHQQVITRNRSASRYATGTAPRRRRI